MVVASSRSYFRGWNRTWQALVLLYGTAVVATARNNEARKQFAVTRFFSRSWLRRSQRLALEEEQRKVIDGAISNRLGRWLVATRLHRTVRYLQHWAVSPRQLLSH